MLAPKSEATALSRSSSERGHAAEAMPRARPPTVENRSAVPGRSSVAPRRPSTSGSTGRFNQIERPGSRRTTGPSQCTYWTGSGSFSPSESRSRARSSFVACEPSMISAGSPGERCSTPKMTIDTPTRTGTSSRSRRGGERPTRPGSLQRDRLDAEVEARMELEPLHALAVRRGLDLVIDEDPRRVLDQQALGLAVELGPLGLIGRQPRLVEQLVVLLVLVERAIGAVGRPLARVQKRVHHEIG